MIFKLNDPAPDFTLENNHKQKISISQYRGSYVVLFFYPKDDTSGCTRECIDFSQKINEFEKLGAKVIGLSRDSISSHMKFIDKHDLKIDLLSDPDTKVLQAYGSWIEKSMYGKKYMGVDRSTFIISPEGNLIEIFKKVKVTGHIDKVLKRLQEIITASNSLS